MSEDKYASPYDTMFDSFISQSMDYTDNKVNSVELTTNRTLSWASKKAADAKFGEDANGNRFSREHIRTNVLGAYRFAWDKETKSYVMAKEALGKMVELLEAHGYEVTAPEEE